MYKPLKTIIILFVVMFCLLVGGIIVKQYFLGGSMTVLGIQQEVVKSINTLLKNTKTNTWNLMEISPKVTPKIQNKQPEQQITQPPKAAYMEVDHSYKKLVKFYIIMRQDLENGKDFTTSYNRLHTNSSGHIKKMLEPIQHLSMVHTDAQLLDKFNTIADDLLFNIGERGFWQKMIKIYRTNGKTAANHPNDTLLLDINEIKAALLSSNYIRAYAIAKKIRVSNNQKFNTWLKRLHNKLIAHHVLQELEEYLLKISGE